MKVSLPLVPLFIVLLAAPASVSATTIVTFDGRAADGQILPSLVPFQEQGLTFTPNGGGQSFADDDALSLGPPVTDDVYYFDTPDSELQVRYSPGTFDLNSTRYGGLDVSSELTFTGTFADGTWVTQDLRPFDSTEVTFFSGFQGLESLSITSRGAGQVYLDNLFLQLNDNDPTPPPPLPQPGLSSVTFSDRAPDGQIVPSLVPFEEAGYLLTPSNGNFLDDDVFNLSGEIDDDAFFFDLPDEDLRITVASGTFDLSSSRVGSLDDSSSLSFTGLFADGTSIVRDLFPTSGSEIAFFTGFEDLESLIVRSGGTGQVYLDNVFLNYRPETVSIPLPASLPLFAVGLCALAGLCRGGPAGSQRPATHFR